MRSSKNLKQDQSSKLLDSDLKLDKDEFQVFEVITKGFL